MLNCARLTLLLCAALVAASAELSAGDGIYRCLGANGVPVFADRSCSALGVLEHEVPPEVPTPELVLPLSQPHLVRGCPREVDTLETWVRAALDAGDVNDLAGLYHWVDASVYTADRVLPGLQALSRRPLIDIETESGYLEGVYQPLRLWLEQYDPERPGKTIRTGFFLVLNAGCWWLHG